MAATNEYSKKGSIQISLKSKAHGTYQLSSFLLATLKLKKKIVIPRDLISGTSSYTVKPLTSLLGVPTFTRHESLTDRRGALLTHLQRAFS